jgi:hypothetical protein
MGRNLYVFRGMGVSPLTAPLVAPMPQIPSSPVIQVGNLQLTQGNIVVYGGEVLAIVLALTLPSGPLKTVATVGAVGGGLAIGYGLMALRGL